MVSKQQYLASWKMTMAIFIAYLPVALGVVECHECRPLDLQQAPGVAIDLTMAYATASIRFRNGTIRPLAMINGTTEYREAMKTIIQGSIAGEKWPWHTIIQTQYIPYTKWWWPVVWAKFRVQNAISPPNLDPIYPDPIPEYYIAIAAMLSDLKSSVLDPLDPPLKYNKVFLSVPDAPPFIYEIVNRFELPCSLAGLEMLGGDLASLHALKYDGVDDWWGPGNEPPAHIDFYYPRMMLTISFNAASLGVSLSARYLGSRDPIEAFQSPRHGADHIQHINGFWDEVQELLARTIADAPVDHILLIGSHAREVSLVEALARAIERSGDIDPSLLDRYQANASEDDRREELFGSANQATWSARWGMKSGYSFCIVPDHCPVDEGGDEEFAGVDWYEILGVPKEPFN
ncbi:hypothetical protein BJX66DRAFT_68086 [Aspergillus keveii]|uniref:Uncharacterized protein n=1 Tax=Aspergillus keveii TaxID=714993 RepID=A0ABR4FPA3_9EURO